MTAIAIGPQNIVTAIGINPSTVEIAVSMIGRNRDNARLDDRIPDIEALRQFKIDLLDQDHRISGNHPEQRQNPEDGHEPERLVKEEERRNDADQAHRDDAQHKKETIETLQLDHQER